MKNSKLKILSSLQQQWLCPISQQPMLHPMVANDGHSYQKSHIKQWFTYDTYGNPQSPITRETLYQNRLVSNYVLQNVISKSNQIIPKFQQKLNQSLNQLQRVDEFIFNLYMIMTKQLQLYQKIRNIQLIHDKIIHYQQKILQQHTDWEKISIKYNRWKQNQQLQRIKLEQQNQQLIKILLFVAIVVGVVLGCGYLFHRWGVIGKQLSYQIDTSLNQSYLIDQLLNYQSYQIDTSLNLFKIERSSANIKEISFANIKQSIKFYEGCLAYQQKFDFSQYQQNYSYSFDPKFMNFEQNNKTQQSININFNQSHQIQYQQQQQIQHSIFIIIHQNPITTYFLSILSYPFQLIFFIASFIIQSIVLSIYNQFQLIYKFIQFFSIQIIQLNNMVEQYFMKILMFGGKFVYDSGCFVVEKIPSILIDVMVCVLRFLSQKYQMMKSQFDGYTEIKEYLVQVIMLINWYVNRQY